MNKDIFNLEKIDDLSQAVKKETRIINVGDDSKKVLNLFNFKKTLTVDEVLVGLYRLHKIEKRRTWVNSTLYNLSRKNLIKKIDGVGVYQGMIKRNDE